MSHDANREINNPYQRADYVKIYGAEWVEKSKLRHLARLERIEKQGDESDEGYKWKALWSKGITRKNIPIPNWYSRSQSESSTTGVVQAVPEGPQKPRLRQHKSPEPIEREFPF